METLLQLEGLAVSDIRELWVERPSAVFPSCPVELVLAKLHEGPRARHVYVVDAENTLLGSIRMSAALGYFFPETAHAEGLLPRRKPQDGLFPSGSPTAADMMDDNPFYVEPHTQVSFMAKIMINERINELPVVDGSKRLIGQVNMYEVIAAYLRKFGSSCDGRQKKG